MCLKMFSCRYPAKDSSDFEDFEIQDIVEIRRALGLPLEGMPDSTESRYALIGK